MGVSGTGWQANRHSMHMRFRFGAGNAVITSVDACCRLGGHTHTSCLGSFATLPLHFLGFTLSTSSPQPFYPFASFLGLYTVSIINPLLAQTRFFNGPVSGVPLLLLWALRLLDLLLLLCRIRLLRLLHAVVLILRIVKLLPDFIHNGVAVFLPDCLMDMGRQWLEPAIVMLVYFTVLLLIAEGLRHFVLAPACLPGQGVDG